MTSRALIAACLTGTLFLLAGCGGGSKGGVPTPGAVPTPSQPSSTAGSTTSSSGSTGSSAVSSSAASGSTSGGTTAPATGSTASTGANKAAPKVEAPKYDPVKVGPLAPGAEAVMGPLTIKLGLMDARSAGTQAPGQEFFLIQLTVKNTGPVAYTIDPTTITLVQPDGKVLKVSTQAMATKTEKINVAIEPGQTLVGWVGYITKLDDGNYKLNITPPGLGEAVFVFEAPPM